MMRAVPKPMSTGDAGRRTAQEMLGPSERSIEDAVPQGIQGRRKGRLTPARLVRRERCVKELKAEGTVKSRAFAICTASVLGTTKRAR